MTSLVVNNIGTIMRVFVGLDIDEEIRAKIAGFVAEVRRLAPDVRWVAVELLHVTLKFIGEKPEAAVAEIEKALRSVSADGLNISFRGYGFFPTAKAARVFWVGIEGDARLAELAATVEDKLAGIGIAKEERAFSPHLTLARGGARIGSGSGAPGRRSGDRVNQRFAKLQQRLANLPTTDFGTMAAREFFLYRSQLSPKGARYSKIARFGLGPSEE
jgi:2'-5' RNA ligase